MLYALLLLLLVTSMYAILGSQLFGDDHPELFGRFSIALFTVASCQCIVVSPCCLNAVLRYAFHRIDSYSSFLARSRDGARVRSSPLFKLGDMAIPYCASFTADSCEAGRARALWNAE